MYYIRQKSPQDEQESAHFRAVEQRKRIVSIGERKLERPSASFWLAYMYVLVRILLKKTWMLWYIDTKYYIKVLWLWNTLLGFMSHNYDSVCSYINLKPSTPVSSLFSKKSVLNIRPNGWTFAENNWKNFNVVKKIVTTIHFPQQYNYHTI